MSEWTYNTTTAVLAIGIVIAFVVMLISLFAMIVRWKTPNRRAHVIRLFGALAAITCLIGVAQALLWLVFLPSFSRQRMAENNAAREERLADTTLVRVGDSVPQFPLTTADGGEFSLPEDDKVILINFFATWCGPCQVGLLQIERIWAANRSNAHFRMLIIGREETTESVRGYRNKHGFSFPIAADPDRAVYSLFAKESIPRTLVVSPGGRIVDSKAGFSADDLEELKAVLRVQLASAK